MSSQRKWSGLFYEGCYFLKDIHDEEALKEHRIDDWDIRDDDIVVVAFPKSGTNWLVNALSLLLPDASRSLPSTGKTPRPCLLYEKPVESDGVYAEQQRTMTRSLQEMKSPRIIFTHVTPKLFHSRWRTGKIRCKIIYITRNPKDVCVSYYHCVKCIGIVNMSLPWADWVREFTEGRIAFGPWLEHVSSWKRYGLDDNVLHVDFEDMKKDLKSVLMKMSEFLGRRQTEKQLIDVIERCTFDRMKKEGLWTGDGSYYRKGEVGNWKRHFTVAQNEEFDEQITSKLKEHGLDLNFQ
ncbi:amine sulfotransferase-like [Glandiceps talaboti]